MKKLEFSAAQIERLERNLDVTRVSCKFSRVRAIERQSFRGRAARVIVSGRIGYASTTDGLTDDHLVRRAIDAAQVDVPGEFSFPNAIIASARIDSALNELSETDLCDLAQETLRGIAQRRTDIMIELEVRRVRETVGLRNTSGGAAYLARVWLEGEAWVERHSGGNVLVALDGFATARADDAHLEFARRMARRLRWARQPIEPQPGPQSVILSPTAFASLLRPMLFALNGTHAFQSGSRGSKRRSGFATRIGQQLFDPSFSLYDDATLPDRPHSAPVDHEGTPGQRTLLIKEGVVNGFYHNLISAALAETRSTGNGWRWMIDPPQPAPTNVGVERGNLPLADLLRNFDHGLLIDLVGESDSSIGLSGDFSRTVVLAYQVKHGGVAGFVRGAGLSGDLYRSLQNIEALGRDGFWSGDIFAPYVQLGGLRVTT